MTDQNETTERGQVDPLVRNLRVKAGVMGMGERIEWGSDTRLMYQAADRIEKLREELEHCAKILSSLTGMNFRASELTQLLDCPFCGGAVDWCDCGMSDDDHLHDGCHQIKCKVCGNFDFTNGHMDGGETLEDLRYCMAVKWNRRAG